MANEYDQKKRHDQQASTIHRQTEHSKLVYQDHLTGLVQCMRTASRTLTSTHISVMMN